MKHEITPTEISVMTLKHGDSNITTAKFSDFIKKEGPGYLNAENVAAALLAALEEKDLEISKPKKNSEDVDFDDQKYCIENQDVVVGIPVGALYLLLTYYYAPGSELDHNNDRLKEVLNGKDNFLLSDFFLKDKPKREQ